MRLRGIKNLKFFNESCLNSPLYIKNDSVDLFFCDPPYYISGSLSKKIDIESGMRQDWDRQWSSKEEYYEWTENWMKLMHSQLKATGSAYICICWQHSGAFQILLEKCGFLIQNRITWKRDKGRGSKTNWKSMHEDIWFVSKSNKYTFNSENVMEEKEVIAPYKDAEGNPKDWAMKDGIPMRQTYAGNLWTNYVVPFWSMFEVRSYAKTKRTPQNNLQKHNTQKPKDLVKRCILASSNKGNIVVDYFGGSGTTAIACLELERRCVIFDQSPICIKMLKTRVKNELKKLDDQLFT